MRIEYAFELSQVDVPRFSVEAVEGIGKVFTLATLVLNVLDSKPRLELVFHGLNPEDPERKIVAFKEILGSCSAGDRVCCGMSWRRQRRSPRCHPRPMSACRRSCCGAAPIFAALSGSWPLPRRKSARLRPISIRSFR